MKTIAITGFLTAILAATSAQAQVRAPYDAWCRDMQLGRGSVMVCKAYTYEQCMAGRTSHVESCYLNPRYDPRFRRG